jgi:hypothetical protein
MLSIDVCQIIAFYAFMYYVSLVAYLESADGVVTGADSVCIRCCSELWLGVEVQWEG